MSNRLRMAMLPGRLMLLLAASAGVRHSAAGTTSAPAAAPRHWVSVKETPGYQPLQDPDSLAEKLGRRPNAAYVTMPFDGGGHSLGELGRAVCGALHTSSPDSMLRLCVQSDEFRVILWPEFPQSRPATGLRWDDAWPVLWGRLNGGSVSATRELGGHVYTFLKLERSAATVTYRNFKLHNGITLVAKSDDGTLQRFTFIRSIAERKGRFKIYSMSD